MLEISSLLRCMPAIVPLDRETQKGTLLVECPACAIKQTSVLGGLERLTKGIWNHLIFSTTELPELRRQTSQYLRFLWPTIVDHLLAQHAICPWN